jgi:hypothetical protein
MKSAKRKLSIHSQTLRYLSGSQLEQVVGAGGSARFTMCSTALDSGCCQTQQQFCATPTCPTEAVGCTSVY